VIEFSSVHATSLPQMNSVPSTMRNFTRAWNRSHESSAQCWKPRFSGVPTGSSMRKSPGATLRQLRDQPSRSPAFQSAT
jgi:hypothetical protein